MMSVLLFLCLFLFFIFGDMWFSFVPFFIWILSRKLWLIFGNSLKKILFSKRFAFWSLELDTKNFDFWDFENWNFGILRLEILDWDLEFETLRFWNFKLEILKHWTWDFEIWTLELKAWALELGILKICDFKFWS